MAYLKIKTEKGLQYIGDKRIDDITIAGVLTTDGNGNLESKELDNNFQRPLDKFSGIVKQTLAEDNTNSFSAAEVGIDYQGPPLSFKYLSSACVSEIPGSGIVIDIALLPSYVTEIAPLTVKA